MTPMVSFCCLCGEPHNIQIAPTNPDILSAMGRDVVPIDRQIAFMRELLRQRIVCSGGYQADPVSLGLAAVIETLMAARIAAGRPERTL